MMKNVHIGWGPVGLTKIMSKVEKLKLNANRVTLDLEELFKIEIISEFEETPIWESSNEKVAKVDQEGNVTIVGYGIAYITVTSGQKKGTCVITVPEPVIPDEPIIPDEPTKLDNTKIYYGTVQAPLITSFSELTEDDIVKAVESGTLQTAELGELETDITVQNEGDLVVILIPSDKYIAGIIEINGSKHGFIDNTTGVNFHSNGEIELGDFHVFGKWMLATGLLTIYVE